MPSIESVTDLALNSDPLEDVLVAPRRAAALTGGVAQPPTKWMRHWLTGEWVEVPLETSGGRVIVAVEGGRETTRVLSRRDYNRELKPLSIKPEEATPERVRQYNEDSRRHNTGAVYDKEGRCFTSSRQSQNREMRLRGKINNDAGFGDYAGR